MAKEVSYDGFGTAPVLSSSLFEDHFILSRYRPLRKMHFGAWEEPSIGYVDRLNGAARMMVQTAIEGEDYWGAYYLDDVRGIYEKLFMQLSSRRYKGVSSDFLLSFHMGVERLCEITVAGLEVLKPERKKGLFASSATEHRSVLVHAVASIAYESLASIANQFMGVDDESWIHAIGVFTEIYPSIGDAPAGMNPLQQQLAVQLIDKLQHNMEGTHPAISRVLLALIGPYENRPKITARTGYAILTDAVYRELQRLPALHAKDPVKFMAFLPPNITYDVSNNTLIHTYSTGRTDVTKLSELNIPEVNLADQSNWQI